MKVLYQSQGLITDSYKQFFRANLPEDVDLIFPEDGKSETLLNLAPEAEVFVGYAVTPEFMDKATKLRHIQVPWTGFNSLDTSLLQHYNHITVSNSHSNSLSIAEHAVSLLLAAAKLLPYRDSTMREGDWSSRYEDINSFWITGKTLGIIGYGAIGQKVAKMLKYGFNMKVMAIKRNPSAQKDEFADFIGGQDDIDQVIAESDFLLISTPLTKETEGIINADRFEKMKDNVVIVNIARGAVMDEQALYESLKNGKIGGAGIDVWYNYPQSIEQGKTGKTSQNYPFEELDNIVMTPHSAYKIRDREEIFAQDILENIKLVYHRKEPINQVNLELGY